MKIAFKYNLEKDIENFFIASRTLGHGGKPSSMQLLYEQQYGKELTEENLKRFINDYLKQNKINTKKRISEFQKSWDKVNGEFFKRAEKFFEVELPGGQVDAYLTINDRCGYSIKDNLFFVHMESDRPKRIVMHELFHFYTWFTVGREFKNKNVDKKRYYDIKESLTEILNLEFKDLIEYPEPGYPEHKELRKKVKKYWLKYKNVRKVVNKILNCP